MSTKKNVQIVKDFFAAIGAYNKQDLLALVAQGDRVLVVGVATGKIKATNRPFKDHWVFDITVRNGKLTKIREYIDTQALARASQIGASPRP